VNRIQHKVTYFAVVVGSIVVWILLSVSGLLEGLEQEAMRWRYLVRGEKFSPAPIVHVDLDADSVASIGARPWDRTNFAVLLHALLGPGEAKAVGVDIIFSQLGRGSLLDVERTKAGDAALGEVVAYFNDQVVLAAAYTGTIGPKAVPLIRLGFDDPTTNVFPESPSFPIIDWEVGRLGLANVDEVLGRGVVPHWVVGFVELEGELYSRVLMGGMRNHFFEILNGPTIVENAETFALSDKDGWTPREIPRQSKQTIYTLGLEVFLLAHGLSHEQVEQTAESIRIYKDGSIFREVPLVEQQSIEVNWFQGWKVGANTEHVSMKTVLLHADALARAKKAGDAQAMAQEEAWFQRFKDKVIFVGPVDPQLKDVAPTPFNREPVPKVGLHANLYRTLESGEYISRAGPVQSVLILVLLTVAVTILTLWSGRFQRITRLGSVGLLLGYTGLVFGGFSFYNLALPLVAPICASLSAALGIVTIKLGAEELERRRIKSLFGSYVSPELVNEMVEAQRDPELGGVEAEISAFFTDVEGFSNLAEELHPDELVALMNEYLSAMTEVIQSEGGTLDKYIGDAIVTMFGMPLPLEDHAARACVAAQRMQQRHASLREEWAASGKWPVGVLSMRTRIGINSGIAVIGNMGSRVRFNYTMMGDSVNLAARCESAAKTYGVYTMVTESTLLAAQQRIPELVGRKLDKIIVRGRKRPTEVYELWDGSGDLGAWSKCRERYELALADYFAGNWTAALTRFEQSALLEQNREFVSSTPSMLMADRCRELIKDGSPLDWDGAYRMATK
jgi:adenylate cyclase